MFPKSLENSRLRVIKVPSFKISNPENVGRKLIFETIFKILVVPVWDHLGANFFWNYE